MKGRKTKLESPVQSMPIISTLFGIVIRMFYDDGVTYNYEKGAYATIPLHWDDARQTLTIGERQGNFPGMLERRTFNIVWVAAGHGAGVDPSTAVDKSVQYDGKAIQVAP